MTNEPTKKCIPSVDANRRLTEYTRIAGRHAGEERLDLPLQSVWKSTEFPRSEIAYANFGGQDNGLWMRHELRVNQQQKRITVVILKIEIIFCPLEASHHYRHIHIVDILGPVPSALWIPVKRMCFAVDESHFQWMKKMRGIILRTKNHLLINDDAQVVVTRMSTNCIYRDLLILLSAIRVRLFQVLDTVVQFTCVLYKEKKGIKNTHTITRSHLMWNENTCCSCFPS